MENVRRHTVILSKEGIKVVQEVDELYLLVWTYTPSVTTIKLIIQLGMPTGHNHI